MPAGGDPFSTEAYDASDASVAFGLLPGDLPFEAHAPQFGLLGYSETAPSTSDVEAAGSAAALPATPEDLTTPTVLATLVIAGVGTVLVRLFVFDSPRRAPRRR